MSFDVENGLHSGSVQKIKITASSTVADATKENINLGEFVNEILRRFSDRVTKERLSPLEVRILKQLIRENVNTFHSEVINCEVFDEFCKDAKLKHRKLEAEKSKEEEKLAQEIMETPRYNLFKKKKNVNVQELVDALWSQRLAVEDLSDLEIDVLADADVDSIFCVDRMFLLELQVECLVKSGELHPY